MTRELDYANEKLERLHNDAKKVAPKKEWGVRLLQNDLPADIEAVNKELKGSMSSVNSIFAARSDDQRRTDILMVMIGLKTFFTTVNFASYVEKEDKASSKSKKRKESGEDVIDLVDAQMIHISNCFEEGLEKKRRTKEESDNDEKSYSSTSSDESPCY